MLRDTSLGEAEVLPAFRVHRAVKLHSVSPEHYSRLSQAVWNTIINKEMGRRQLESLFEETNPGLAVVIKEAQEALSTAIAKKKGVVIMASPAAAINMMQVGYKLRFQSRTDSGTHLAVGADCVGHLNEQLSHKDDVVTGWRPWKQIIEGLFNRELHLSDIPKFLRCRNCPTRCGMPDCPLELLQ